MLAPVPCYQWLRYPRLRSAGEFPSTGPHLHPEASKLQKTAWGAEEPRLRPASQRLSPRGEGALALRRRGGQGKGGGDPLRGESGSKVAPRCRVAALGTHQAANGCAELYSRWRPTALFLPRPPPPLASVLRSQSHHQVARRWNGWSPNTHHHLSCAWEARVQVAPRGCGSSGQAGECGVHRGCPAPGQQGDRRQERGGGLTRG